LITVAVIYLPTEVCALICESG